VNAPYGETVFDMIRTFSSDKDIESSKGRCVAVTGDSVFNLVVLKSVLAFALHHRGAIFAYLLKSDVKDDCCCCILRRIASQASRDSHGPAIAAVTFDEIGRKIESKLVVV
jgi:hypothetical protein